MDLDKIQNIPHFKFKTPTHNQKLILLYKYHLYTSTLFIKNLFLLLNTYYIYHVPKIVRKILEKNKRLRPWGFHPHHPDKRTRA